MRAFDRKFGAKFFDSIPGAPGVYRMFDASGVVVYVGKAKNLRRRLGQYRNAKRTRRQRKMLAILKDAQRIEWQLCESDLDACLLETRLIQGLRPRWNVAGAFFFLYPLVGMRFEGGGARFCMTSRPELFEGFSMHGAFRSREITGDAFFALMRLLGYVGHKKKWTSKSAKTREAAPRRARIFEFRKLDPEWASHLEDLFSGRSARALEALVLALIENAGARARPEEIQDDLNALKRFWRHEARPLRKALEATAFASYPLPQSERDVIFLRYRAGAGGAGSVSVSFSTVL